jgi:hypothetical protein
VSSSLLIELKKGASGDDFITKNTSPLNLFDGNQKPVIYLITQGPSIFLSGEE